MTLFEAMLREIFANFKPLPKLSIYSLSIYKITQTTTLLSRHCLSYMTLPYPETGHNITVQQCAIWLRLQVGFLDMTFKINESELHLKHTFQT